MEDPSFLLVLLSIIGCLCRLKYADFIKNRSNSNQINEISLASQCISCAKSFITFLSQADIDTRIKEEMILLLMEFSHECQFALNTFTEDSESFILNCTLRKKYDKLELQLNSVIDHDTDLRNEDKLVFELQKPHSRMIQVFMDDIAAQSFNPETEDDISPLTLVHHIRTRAKELTFSKTSSIPKLR